MKKISKSVLLLSSICAMGLVGCNNGSTTNTSNPNSLPETAEAVVEKVAGIANICSYSNGTTLKSGEANSNTVPTGKAIYAATSYSLKAWSNGAEVATTVKLAWALDDATKAKYTIKDKTPDDTHESITPKIPAYGQADLSSVLTCTITYGELTKEIIYNVTVKASTVAPVEYTSLATLKSDYNSKKIAKDTAVTVYGYVTAFTSKKDKVYIQSGETALVVYGSASLFPSDLAIGDLYTVTGNIEIYYLALELVSSTSASKSTKTGIVAMSKIALTADLIKACTTSGWEIGSSIVTCSATLKKSDDGFYFAVGDQKLTPYYSSVTTDAVKTAASALIIQGNVDKTFALNGLVDSYKGAAEIIPVNATDWALAD